MTPTVGRIVHYHAPRGEPHGSELALVPAIVCEVESDTELTLYVFDKTKGARFVTSAKKVGEAPQLPQSGQWQWPPPPVTELKLKPGKEYAQPKDTSKTDAPVSA